MYILVSGSNTDGKILEIPLFFFWPNAMNTEYLAAVKYKLVGLHSSVQSFSQNQSWCHTFRWYVYSIVLTLRFRVLQRPELGITSLKAIGKYVLYSTMPRYILRWSRMSPGSYGRCSTKLWRDDISNSRLEMPYCTIVPVQDFCRRICTIRRHEHVTYMKSLTSENNGCSWPGSERGPDCEPVRLSSY